MAKQISASNRMLDCMTSGFPCNTCILWFYDISDKRSTLDISYLLLFVLFLCWTDPTVRKENLMNFQEFFLLKVVLKCIEWYNPLCLKYLNLGRRMRTVKEDSLLNCQSCNSSSLNQYNGNVIFLLLWSALRFIWQLESRD